MIGREDAEFEFGAGGGVGRVGGREFQVGGVLDGQDVFVGIGGKMGIGVWKLGMVGGGLGTMFRNWGKPSGKMRCGRKPLGLG